MRILGIDTATWRASVGVAIDRTIVHEISQTTTGNHAVSLLDLINDTLRAADLSTSSLDAIAVSAGPGSFTGLRIALSTAKGIARATGAALIAIPTLEALAATVADRRGVICPVLDARKGEVYAAAFESTADGLRRLIDDCLIRIDAVGERLPHGGVVVGDAAVRYGETLREQLAATVLPFEQYGPRGGIVAMLAQERSPADGDTDFSLEPFYIRPSEAEVKSV